MIGPSRPSDLASYFCIGKATTGRQLGALDDLGLIERQSDPADRRALLFGLTPVGKQWLDDARATQCSALREKLSDWPPAELEMLADLLHRFNADVFFNADDVASGRVTAGAEGAR